MAPRAGKDTSSQGKDQAISLKKALKLVEDLKRAEAGLPPKKKAGNPRLAEVSKATQFKKDNPATGYRDTRINRAGYLKPRSQRQFEQLLDKIFDEKVELVINGQVVEELSRLELAAIDMMKSRDVRGKIDLLDRRFGKSTDKVKIEQTTKKIIVRIGKVDKDTGEDPG